MYTIFLVEDDDTIAGAIRKYIESWGFRFVCVQDFAHVEEEFRAADPQLVLMDISLPFYDGYHWCQKIRAVSRVPIVFLSSASDKMNIVMAMNMGADDFIAKPFDLTVFGAKIRALLRRTYDFAPIRPSAHFRGTSLNAEDATLSYEGGKLDLTKNEYRILQTLYENPGSFVSRDILMQRLWETDSFVDENTLTVNIARLRKKLESAGLCDFIQTKKGIGYRIGEEGNE